MMDELAQAQALIRLRVELFTAAQVLKGAQLDQLRDLVRDIALILDFEVTDHIPRSS